ncbi:MAG: isochorismatase family protein [Pirellulales bacterium]|nr:isochorismatase family protein [Pirellulales bacterium]
MEAVDLGFETIVIKDGCRGDNLNPSDVDQAIKDLQATGVQVLDNEQTIMSFLDAPRSMLSLR